MASIQLNNVTVDIPVYNAHGRSLKSAVFQRAVGGHVHARKRGDVIVVRALDDVTAAIASGERIGIVGHNGAGKTTMLRVLAGVYQPSTGSAHSTGEVGSLTDLGAGMDMEATGYDNIKYRSILLGHTYAQAKAQVSDIEAFSELGGYLNLPVRTYSTGMLLRLAFAVTTSIRPAILLMDEMISAGDAAFIEKARQRLRDLISSANILVIASHSEAVIREFCTRTIWLEHGKVMMDGEPEAVLAAYRERSTPAA
jgi:lipopolysaccharide transport system ATP-binding protein